jgi:hypothetical protein
MYNNHVCAEAYLHYNVIMSFILKLEALKGPTLHDRVLTDTLAALLDASFSACVRMDSVCRVSTRSVIYVCAKRTCFS